MSTTLNVPVPQADATGALVERILEASIATMDLACVHIGSRLGLYEALRGTGPLTSAQVAARTGLDERYVREWLEQQVVAGVLAVEDAGADAPGRRFSLPEAHVEVLLEPESLNCLAGLARATIGVLSPLEQLVAAFRTGEGVPYPDFGPDTREGIAEMNRPMFANQLGAEWLPALGDVHARIRAADAPRVADLACGCGWSTIALARAYPSATVHGFDVDEASIARARDNVAAAGLEERVRFFVQDASDEGLDGSYDLATIFEAVHDMSHPVEALESARRLVAGRGCVLVADERVAERFSAEADPVERLCYGFSVLHCLAVGREDASSAGTGTVMRPGTLRDYARRAGFSGAQVLPVEHDFWWLYRLDP
jgi:precorrin-6B methylase 2